MLLLRSSALVLLLSTLRLRLRFRPCLFFLSYSISIDLLIEDPLSLFSLIEREDRRQELSLASTYPRESSFPIFALSFALMRARKDLILIR